MSIGLSRWSAAGIPIAKLTPTLSRILERPVVDKTELAGIFDVDMEWTPDVVQFMTQAMPLPADVTKPSPSEAAGLTIFTAIREQLGLRLESSKGPVEVLVIDSIQRPKPN